MHHYQVFRFCCKVPFVNWRPRCCGHSVTLIISVLQTLALIIIFLLNKEMKKTTIIYYVANMFQVYIKPEIPKKIYITCIDLGVLLVIGPQLVCRTNTGAV